MSHEISNKVVWATSKGSDQPAHMRSLIRVFASCLNILRATDRTPFGFSKLNRRLYRLVWVYTCQNAPLMKIICRGSQKKVTFSIIMPTVTDSLRFCGGVGSMSGIVSILGPLRSYPTGIWSMLESRLPTARAILMPRSDNLLPVYTSSGGELCKRNMKDCETESLVSSSSHSRSCADAEGAQEVQHPPWKIIKNLGFLSNTGPDPWKIEKLPNQHSMLGHHRKRFADGPMMVRL